MDSKTRKELINEIKKQIGEKERSRKIIVDMLEWTFIENEILILKEQLAHLEEN